MGYIVFKKTYQEMKDAHINLNFRILIPTVGLSLIVFVIVYHRYILLMAFGAFILWFMTNMFGSKDSGEFEASATAVSGSASGGNGNDGYQPSYNSGGSGQQERIAFSQYDFTKGNIVDDIHRIDF